MIESAPRLSAPSLAHARQTYEHCIRYLLIQWFNPPRSVPEQEAIVVQADIRRVIWLLLDELEMSVPGARDQLLCEMRGLSYLLSTPSPGASLESLTTLSIPVNSGAGSALN
jgi:hypothetical protein